MTTAILIGPPGAGKSTVGPLLAGLLRVTFLDTDSDIEQAAGKPVAYPLQLLQGEQARTVDSFALEVWNVCRRDVRERVRNDHRALTLELSDLSPEGDARVALADLNLTRARD